jgi:hypothetical protein
MGSPPYEIELDFGGIYREFMRIETGKILDFGPMGRVRRTRTGSRLLG